LIIAGTGEETILREVQEQVRALGVNESVRLDLRFLRVEEVSLYYQAADIVVYPYKEITTSGALMTGGNYKKAIVATDLPSFREVLGGGGWAELFVGEVWRRRGLGPPGRAPDRKSGRTKPASGGNRRRNSSSR